MTYFSGHMHCKEKSHVTLGCVLVFCTMVIVSSVIMVTRIGRS